MKRPLWGVFLILLGVFLVVLVVAARATTLNASEVIPYGIKRGCTHVHKTGGKHGSYQVVKGVLRNHQPLNKKRTSKLSHWAVCVRTKAKSKAVWDFIRRSYKWRKQYVHFWWIKFHSLPSYAQSWAWSTASCETGGTMNRYAFNPAPFYSYFQWVLHTWWSAGGDRHPYDAIFPHQAVLAWNWHVNHPSGQWPVCGE